MQEPYKVAADHANAVEPMAEEISSSKVTSIDI